MFFAVIFFFALGAIVDSREASGQSYECPTGYSESTTNFWFNGCLYTVRFCYKCTVSGASTLSVIPFEVIAQGTGCGIPLDPALASDFQSAMLGSLRVAVNSLCSNPPCGTGTIIQSTTLNLCWKIQNIPGNLMHPPTQRLILCEGAKCVLIEEVCWDYSGGGEPVRVVVNSSKVQTGTVECMSFEDYWSCCVQDINFPWTTDCINFFECE